MRVRSVPLSIGLAVAALAALTSGCEIVAGIQDIELTTPNTDATTTGSPDAAGTSGIDADATVVDAPSGTDIGDATVESDATGADATDASPGLDAGQNLDAPATSDANDDGTALDANDAGANETGIQSGSTDGGPLLGPDGGLLVLELIDDMEGKDPSPGWLDGPNVTGTWFTFDDGTDGGVLTPPPGSLASAVIALIELPHPTYGGVSSLHAAHVNTNDGFSVYGDGMGFNVNVAAGTPLPFDASTRQGFVFWARALGDTGAPGTRFNVMDVNTAPPGSGGVCDGGACNGYFGFEFGKNGMPPLTSEWQMYVVYFSELTRPAWALPDPSLVFDPTQMIGCQWQLPVNTPADLWVDDIYFIDR